MRTAPPGFSHDALNNDAALAQLQVHDITKETQQSIYNNNKFGTYEVNTISDGVGIPRELLE